MGGGSHFGREVLSRIVPALVGEPMPGHGESEADGKKNLDFSPQPGFASADDGLRPVCDLELGEDVGDMVLNRL